MNRQKLGQMTLSTIDNNQWSLAEEQLTELLQSNRTSSALWLALGLSLQERGLFLKALQAYTLAGLYQPNDSFIRELAISCTAALQNLRALQILEIGDSR